MTCYPAAPCDSADVSQEWSAAGVWETFETELHQDECVEAQPQEVFLEAEPQETNDKCVEAKPQRSRDYAEGWPLEESWDAVPQEPRVTLHVGDFRSLPAIAWDKCYNDFARPRAATPRGPLFSRHECEAHQGDGRFSVGVAGGGTRLQGGTIRLVCT